MEFKEIEDKLNWKLTHVKFKIIDRLGSSYKVEKITYNNLNGLELRRAIAYVMLFDTQSLKEQADKIRRCFR